MEEFGLMLEETSIIKLYTMVAQPELLWQNKVANGITEEGHARRSDGIIQ